MTIAQELEITRLKARIEELEEAKILKPFVDEFLQNIGVLLTQLPYDQWPMLCITAFKPVAAAMPTAAELYKRKLPK